MKVIIAVTLIALAAVAYGAEMNPAIDCPIAIDSCEALYNTCVSESKEKGLDNSVMCTTERAACRDSLMSECLLVEEKSTTFEPTPPKIVPQ